MATTTTITEQEYRELVWSDDDHKWELWDGVPVEKPLMSMRHDTVATYMGIALANQLDPNEYLVNINSGKTRYTARNYFIPDVVVIPAAYQQPFEHDPGLFNAHTGPLPFVAEV